MGRRAFGGFDHHRNARIAAFADFGEQWNFAEECRALPLRLRRTASVAEDFDAVTIRRGEVAHIFHDAEDGHIHALKHRNAFAHHAERGFLRGGDNHAAIKRHRLAQRELCIARARRQIDQQIIQRAPVHLHHKLLDGFHNHRPAPDDRLVALQQKPHTHQLHAVAH